MECKVCELQFLESDPSMYKSIVFSGQVDFIFPKTGEKLVPVEVSDEIDSFYILVPSEEIGESKISLGDHFEFSGLFSSYGERSKSVTVYDYKKLELL